MKNEETVAVNNWLYKLASRFITQPEFEKIEKTSLKLHFRKGETILKQSNIPSHIVYLEKGIVKFNFEDDIKRNIILTVVSAPKILGGANLFYKDNNLFSIIAVVDCDVILIDSATLLGVMSDNARFSMALFQIASQMFKSSILNFISLATKQKEGRIADIILYLVSDVYGSTTFNLTFTRKELSEFASCSPENLIMTLSKWHAQQIINMTGRKIEIVDMERLKLISKIG